MNIPNVSQINIQQTTNLSMCGFQSQCQLNHELVKVKENYEKTLKAYQELFDVFNDKVSEVANYQHQVHETDVLMHQKESDTRKMMSKFIEMAHRLCYIFVDNKIEGKTDKDSIDKDDIRLCVRFLTMICNKGGLSLSDIMKEDIGVLGRIEIPQN